MPSRVGDLFSIYYHPAHSASRKEDVLYIHPFADEMNKSRHMAAQQAQALARAGFGVLQVDLHGCGDSQGEFCDARWDIWKENISSAVQWLHDKGQKRISLWGLRLGSLLMMDWYNAAAVPVDHFIFWQPVLNGELALKHFFRLAAASQMMGREGTSSKEIRERLGRGQTVEVGGYELHPDLVDAIEKVHMESLCPPENSRLIWREVSLSDSPQLGPASRKVIDTFKSNGCYVDAESISGTAFWSSVEIATVPDLVSSTTDALGSVSQ